MANSVAYGFYDLQNVFNSRVTEVGVDVVNAAIQQTMDEHNRQVDALMNLFVMPTTKFKQRYLSAVAARLQPLDEIGRARPIQTAGYYEVAWPIQRAGTAWGATYEARIKMTVAEANNTLNTLINADARWVRDHILSALYANAAWTFSDPEHGNLTIKGLANGDADTYQIQTGADAPATDTHYWGQANAIDNSNDPFATIYSELTEHPENNGEVIALIPSNLKTATEALSNFYPLADGNLRLGSGQTELVGGLGVQLPGQLLGYHSEKVWVAEWRSLPSNYIIALTTGGERPLAMRQEMEAQLQGFKQVAERADHPFWEAQYMRKAGFGAWNRVGAAVVRIGNGTYAVPTGYGAPMP